MTTYDPGPVVHYLVYGGRLDEDGNDVGHMYSVKHDSDRCPKGEWTWGYDYACGVQQLLYDMGADAFGVFDNELDHTAPGTYVLVAWHETYPGGPWGPTEYDAGLTLGDRIA